MNGITYRVTSIGKNALRNNKTVTKIVIGKNITSIRDNAFQKCTSRGNLRKSVAKLGKNIFWHSNKLKKITFNTAKLNKKGMVKKSLAGIPKNVRICVPKKKVVAYQKLFGTKGLRKGIKVTR